MISTMIDAVADILRGMSQLQDVEVSTSLLRELDAKALAKLRIVVQPVGWSPQAAARTRVKTEVRVGIYLSQIITTDNQAKAMVDLAHAVSVELIGTNVTASTYQFVCTGTDCTPNPDGGLAQNNAMKVLIEATMQMV